MDYVQRIGYYGYSDEARLQRLIEVLHTARTTAVSLFTDDFMRNPSRLPLDEVRRHAAWITYCAAEIRSAGMGVHVNVLTTLGHGHGEDHASFADEVDFAPLVGHDGSIDEGTACPLDPPFRTYIAEVYRLYAAAQADVVWIDDDFRLESHGRVAYGCFCPRHIEAFNHRHGTSYTRESLVTTLQESTAAAGELRRRWLAHTGAGMEDLLAQLAAAVWSVAPATTMGLMVCTRHTPGRLGLTMKRIAAALSAPRGERPAVFRPGCLFYEDLSSPFALFSKIEDAARTVEPVHPGHRCYSEVECFPYNPDQKSVHTLLWEMVLNQVLAGQDGHTLNFLGAHDTPPADRSAWLGAVARARPHLEALAAEVAGTDRLGVAVPDPEDLFAHALSSGQGALNQPVMGGVAATDVLTALGYAGIATCAGATKTGGPVILTGDVPLALGRENVLALLGGGMLLDWPAARHLREMGLDGLADLVADAPGPTSMLNEVLTDDAMNDPYAGQWAALLAARGAMAARGNGVRVLSRLVGRDGRDTGAAVLAVEHRRGGRLALCAAPLAAWLGSPATPARRLQLARLLAWLGGEESALPCWVEGPGRVYPVARGVPGSVPHLVALFNCSFDPAEGIVLHVAGAPGVSTGWEELTEEGRWHAAVATVMTPTTFALAPLPPLAYRVLRRSTEPHQAIPTPPAESP